MTVLDERIVLAIGASAIGPERGLDVAFKDRLLVEGDSIGLVRFRHGGSPQGGFGRAASDLIGDGSEHRIVVRRRLRDRLDHIPVLDHLAVFPSEDVTTASPRGLSDRPCQWLWRMT